MSGKSKKPAKLANRSAGRAPQARVVRVLSFERTGRGGWRPRTSWRREAA